MADGIGIRLILATLMAFGALSTDLYLPALPLMGKALNASHGTMELTISSYLVGFSLTQLIWGPVSDRWGRKGPVLAGLALFVVGSAGCAMSHSVAVVILFRLIQATGACSGVVLARAMVRDRYARDKAAEILSTLIIIMAIAPLVGPLLGAYILHIGSWRLIFWLLVLIGFATMAAVWTLPETLPPAMRSRQGIGSALRIYRGFFRDRQVIGYAAVGGFYYAGSFAFIAGSPFAYISFYGASPMTYAILFAASIIGIMSSNYINVRLVSRVGSETVLFYGGIGAAITGASLCVLSITEWGGLAAFATALTLFVSMAGFMVANSLASAMAKTSTNLGAVSAFTGTLHYGGGILGSALVGLFADGSLRPIGFVVAGSGLLSLTTVSLLRRR